MKKILTSIFRLNRSGMGRIFGDLEKSIMEILWEHNKGITGREIFDIMKNKKGVAFTTVLTVLERLSKKGLIKRTKKDRLFIYRPAISRDEFIRKISEEVVQGLMDISATHAASSFVDVLEKTSPQELERLASLIEEKKKKLSR